MIKAKINEINNLKNRHLTKPKASSLNKLTTQTFGKTDQDKRGKIKINKQQNEIGATNRHNINEMIIN